MKALLGAVVCFLLVAVSLGQTTQNCAQYQQSCGKCYMNGCSYYWGQPGLYNSAVNGSCVSTSVFNDMMWKNQYTKTVYAYALREDEVNTTLGQRKLTILNSAKNYLARPVLCFDRHLCYCKPMPPPPPARLRVWVVDATNLKPITGAIVMVNANLTGPKTTPLNAPVEYYPIPYGSYIANATADGYLPNSAPTGSIGANQTVEITIPLTPLPCIVTVKTYSLPGKVILPGVSVTLGSPGQFPVQVTSANGTLVYSIQYTQASGVTGTITGYSDQSASFVCTRGGTPTVELIFPPIPNQVTLEVRDKRTNNRILSATAGLSTFTSSHVDANAQVSYSSVAAGAYTASASAPGYISNNSVSIGTLTFAQNVVFIIYLTELPCGVLVTVYNQRNNATVSGASVALNDGVSTGVSSSTGSVFFSILYDAANNASASAFGFNSGWSAFNPSCDRGINISVPIYLVEVIVLKIAARDVASPSKPYINTAVISWNGQTLTQNDPVFSYFRILQVTNLPQAGTILATARGFNSKTTTYTFVDGGPRNFTVSLAPQQFTLFFIPQELVFDPSTPKGQFVPVNPAAVIASNYTDDNGLGATDILRDPKPINVGGFAVQIAQPNVSRSYTPNTNIISIDGVTSFGVFMAARFDNVVPTSLSPFVLSMTTDLDNMLFNRNNTTPAALTYFVPAYGDIDERSLMSFLPFKLNSGFILVRVFAVNAAQTGLSPFGANDFITCTLSTTRYANYPTPGGYKLAVFEYPTTFGDTVTGIVVAYPTESYSGTKSGFRDEESPVAAPYPILAAKSAAETAYTNFGFNAQTLPNVLIANFNGAGQTARDTTKKIYVTRDYYVVHSAKKK